MKIKTGKLFANSANSKNKIIKLMTALILLVIIAPMGCQSVSHKKAQKDNNPEYQHPHGTAGASGNTNKQALINRITNIKLISWPMPATGECNADLEGSVPPAKFKLSYREKGKDAKIIENNVNELMQNGWEIITRSEGGYGFEKQGEFVELNFDIYEELSCSCNDDSEKNSTLINVKIDWSSGAPPITEGYIINKGARDEAFPVVINGRVAIYEFSFTIPLPAGNEGGCSSKLLAVFSLSNPLK